MPLQFSLAQKIRVVELNMLLYSFCIDRSDYCTTRLVFPDEEEIICFTNLLLQRVPGRTNRNRESLRRETLQSRVIHLDLRRPSQYKLIVNLTILEGRS